MKCIILLSCLIALSYAAGPPELIVKLLESIKKAGKECKPEVGLTEEDVNILKKHGIPTTTSGKCFLACLQKKLDFMTPDGKFDQDVGYKFIGKFKDLDAALYEKIKTLADHCYADVKEETDACESAANMMKCVERERKAVGIPDYEF